MINTSEFSNRLQKVITYYGLTASAFAEKLGTQRSSISHILSGRNKPSLDFVMKILKAFPEVELYWLLNGKGNFPPTPNTIEEPNEPKKIEHPISKVVANDLFANQIVQSKPVSEEVKPNTSKRAIQKIIILYDDGSFNVYEQ